METVRTIADLRARTRAWRSEGLTSAVVPTMGGLHDGHLSLVRAALRKADRVVTTLFVNPTQFSPSEDLSSYPRDEARDAAMLASVECDLLFAPPVEVMYPPGFATEVRVTGLTDCLCGASRPGHFDGVSQIVTKLLNQAQTDIAIFGEKDWQQIAVVRQLARDLDIPTDIIGAPTIREPDGLAMSSRNRYLGTEERAIASHLPRIMDRTATRIADGHNIKQAVTDAIHDLLDAGFRSIDYLEPRTADRLDLVERFDPAIPSRLFIAAHLGHARLIDNIAIVA